MDLGTFGEDGGRRERKKRVAPDKPQQTSPEKRQVPDPGAVPVEIVCEKFGVGVRFQFGANRVRHDLLQTRVTGWSNGLGWNVEARMHMNTDRNDRTKVTCPSAEFLKAICHECVLSDWCSNWYLTDRHGRTIPCSADAARQDYIDYLSVPFAIREDTPEPEEPMPEPEFTCDDVRRDLKKVMKVPLLPRRLRRIASEMRGLARYHRYLNGAIQRETEAELAREARHQGIARAFQRETASIVTAFLGADDNCEITCDRHH